MSTEMPRILLADAIHEFGGPLRSMVGARVVMWGGVGPCGRSLGDCVALLLCEEIMNTIIEHLVASEEAVVRYKARVHLLREPDPIAAGYFPGSR